VSGTECDVVVIGAGAAGLLAAIRSAEAGRQTLLLEKNRRPGVKILMSGGTRCNLTHATDRRGIVEAYGTQGRFLHSALAALGPQELVDLIEAEGVPTKVEETGKVFPVSNKAVDVLQALLRRLERSGARLKTECPVEGIEPQGEWILVRAADEQFLARKVILTTGGKSYPRSGTTGDAYCWAEALGHTIVPPRPALVPVRVDAAWVAELRGITIPDVGLRVVEGAGEGHGKPRVLISRRGSMLFAHFGLSGPVVLDISREISGHPQPRTLKLECDFLPDVSGNALEEQLQKEVAAAGRRPLVTLLAAWWPRRLAEALMNQAGLATELRSADLRREERRRLVQIIKSLPLPVTGTLGFEKAEVTAGGVRLDEVDSRTMQSRVVPNLYLAGEVLDLDGPIGGFNFQAAFSTGWLAGASL